MCMIYNKVLQDVQNQYAVIFKNMMAAQLAGRKLSEISETAAANVRIFS